MSKVLNTRANGFVYTVQNYTDDDIAEAMNLYDEDTNCKYHIIGFETAPRTGTPHMQCYIYFTKKITKSVLEKKLYNAFGRTVYSKCQKAKKNVQAYVYCTEDGNNWYEQGERPRQGHRTDLEMIRADLHKGRPLTEISREYYSQYLFHRRGFDDYIRLHKLYQRDTVILRYPIECSFRVFKMFYDQHPNSKILNDYTLTHLQIIPIYFSKQYDYILVSDIDSYYKKNGFGKISDHIVEQCQFIEELSDDLSELTTDDTIDADFIKL